MLFRSTFFHEMSNGGMRPQGSNLNWGNQTIGPKAIQSVKKHGKSGVMKNGKFIKSMNWKRDIALLVGGPIAVSMGASAVGGFVGRFLDEEVAGRRAGQQMTYDNRFFDSRKYDMNTYDQVGAAMQSYQNKMVSSARIFHSR